MDNTEDKNPDVLTSTDQVDFEGDEEVGEGLAQKVTRFFRRCWLKRRMVFTILAVGISISITRTLLQPNVYTATTTFMPPDSTSSYSNLMNMMGSSSSAASLGSQMLGLETPGELYISILQSRNVLDGLISRLNLVQYYKTRLMTDARKSLAGDTEAVLDRKSGVITVSVTATDATLAANIARGYVTELNRVLTEDSASSAHRERVFLEGRLKEIKQQLDESSNALSQFSSKSGTIDIPSQAKSMMDTGLRLQEELITGRSQLAGLRQTYGEDNPRVRAVEARNAELQQQIDRMGGLDQQRGANHDLKKPNYPSASELPALGLTYFDLQRKVQVEEALWEALTRQYEAARVQEAGETPAARVLDVADVPERKSGPSHRLAVMIGAILSLLVACIAVAVQFVWEGMDPQEEPKKLMTEVAAATMDRRRWYWSLPGLTRVHRLLFG